MFAVIRCRFLSRVCFVSLPWHTAGRADIRPEGEVGPVGQDRVEASESPAAPRQPPPSVRCVLYALRSSLGARAQVQGRRRTEEAKAERFVSLHLGSNHPHPGVLQL